MDDVAFSGFRIKSGMTILSQFPDELRVLHLDDAAFSGFRLKAGMTILRQFSVDFVTEVVGNSA